MYSPANAAILLLLVLVFNIHDSLASGRPRRCYPEDCEVSAWSTWSSCRSSKSDEQESESRSRSVETPASCRGKACPRKLKESRLCDGSKTQNSQFINHWTKKQIYIKLHSANVLQTYVYSRPNLQQTWPHLVPYLHISVNMAANVALTKFTTDLLWRKHMFATPLRCANLM